MPRKLGIVLDTLVIVHWIEILSTTFLCNVWKMREEKMEKECVKILNCCGIFTRSDN